jgi:hypothetical protein
VFWKPCPKRQVFQNGGAPDGIDWATRARDAFACG